MTISEIEQRLAALEQTVEDLKQQIARDRGPDRAWWHQTAGRFANDPVFDEIVRLGQEYRRSLRDEGEEGEGP